MEEQIQQKYEAFLQMPIVAGALRELEMKLPADLTYHSAAHSHDVLKEVLRFAIADGIERHELELLAIGAAYHDLGFISKRVDNEWLGASRAREAMEQAGGYSEAEIQIVQDMILDTQLVSTSMGAVQIPSSNLGQYLLDADLGNLGREDFFEKSELLRREIGISRGVFYVDAMHFVEGQQWFTPAAQKLRKDGQKKNIKRLREYIQSLEKEDEESDFGGLALSQLLFLSRLPILLNSSLHTDTLVATAIEHLRGVTGAGAATVFLLDESGNNLRFWALQGGEAKLQDKLLPKDRGLVGWAIENKQSILTNNPKEDPRFYSSFDKESGFETKHIVCVPLVVRSDKVIGAIQVLNKQAAGGFIESDLLLTERFGHQLALAIDNAHLFEQSERMRNMLAQLDKRKGEMITVLTHELRTPLNVIQGAADLLGDRDVSDVAIREKMTETLQRGVHRLVRLSQQLQSLTRVEGEHVAVQKRTFPLSQLIAAVEERFQNPMRIRNLTFMVNCKNPEQPLHADESLLFLVLMNLLSNAIRFTEDGGTIELSIRTEHGLAHFEVRDTGIGIAEKDQGSVFEKFYEVGDALVHSSGDYAFQSGGLGLGLSTVRNIVAAHGSEVTVVSALGKGSLFSFAVPIE